MNESKFKVGDVVTLKSGGPKMTVRDVLTDVRCNWFVNDRVEESWFYAEQLVSAPVEPAGDATSIMRRERFTLTIGTEEVKCEMVVIKDKYDDLYKVAMSRDPFDSTVVDGLPNPCHFIKVYGISDETINTAKAGLIQSFTEWWRSMKKVGTIEADRPTTVLTTE